MAKEIIKQELTWSQGGVYAGGNESRDDNDGVKPKQRTFYLSSNWTQRDAATIK